MEVAKRILDRSYTLNFVGDWGQANFHRICAWMTEEFCNRAGSESRTAIWSIRGGGIEALDRVEAGEADLCIVTPANLMAMALKGEGLFSAKPAPHIRALAQLPQDDRMILGVDPKFGISSFAELREKRPPLRIDASRDDGTNFIGYVGRLLMQAHGIDEATLISWGGSYVEDTHPFRCLERMMRGEVDAVLQEAVMAPPWVDLVEKRKVILLPAEEDALARLETEHGLGRNDIPAGYWRALDHEVAALDFSDFLVLVRDDLHPDVASVLTQVLVETRGWLEAQYRHLPANRSPVSYPLDPARMAKTTVPLHPAAEAYYRESGHLA